MKLLASILVAAAFSLALIGCAAMDLTVQTLPMSSNFGMAPRVSAKPCRYYTKDNAPDPSTYTVLAQYIVQEAPSVITNRSAETMVCYAYEQAVKKGADAIIVDDMSTTNVAGGMARTSPIVKVRSIRFNGELPSGLK